MKPVPEPRLVALLRPYFDLVCRARLQIDAGPGSGEFASLSAEQLCDRLDQELDRVRGQKNEVPELAALLPDKDPLFADLVAFGTSILASGPSSPVKQHMGVVRTKRRVGGAVQDSDFEKHLRAEMQSINPATQERLVVYSVCLGLGYKGPFVGDEQAVQRLRAELWGHIQKLVPSPRTAHKLSPAVQPLFAEAYDIRTETLSAPPIRWTPVFIACVIAIAAVVMAVVQVWGVGDDLDKALRVINNADEKTVSKSPAAPPKSSSQSTDSSKEGTTPPPEPEEVAAPAPPIRN
jgi:hypothetical protein